MSVLNSPAPEGRRSKRTITRKRASLIVSLRGRAERLPCLVVDSLKGGLRLRGSFRLKRGQVVEVLSDDGFLTVQCRVVWIGKPGSKQEGEAGLETI
jgi:PilZ domain